jgi:DNA polymerase elongation subunit (family B)
MSFVNVHYEHRTNKIHLWEQINGERFYDTIEWVPYVFVRANGHSGRSNIRTIDGIQVVRKDFRSYSHYYEYCKDNEFIFENKVKPEIQFLAEQYHKIPDDELEVPKLLTYTIDIEVNNNEGFPDIQDALDPISLISVRNSIDKRTFTFGEKEYTGDKDINYSHCPNEKQLLENFLQFMYDNAPDVITGWNVYGFDLPYIINRCRTLYGNNTDVFKKLSPIRDVRTWRSNKYNDLNVDIAGIHILDYIDVYKWYARDKLERYTLDFVANYELEKGKLDYSEYKDLRELYTKDWNKYVDYNVIDCKRVDELEDKKGYIKLIQALSLLTKCPMKYYQSMTQLIEGALLTYFRRSDLCAPYHAGGTQETFPAAYVKEPHKGMWDWIIDIDITSSYPSHIITLNMSNETYFGRIVDLTKQQVITAVRDREFPPFFIIKADGQRAEFRGLGLAKFNEAVSRGLLAIAPCGSIFRTNPLGVIAAVQRQLFNKRVQEVKPQMKETFNKAAELPEGDERVELRNRGNELFALQWALKIILNAMFGITAVPYSRYFNTNIAEGITSCGRHSIKQAEVFINDFFKEKGMNEDMVAYIDTDSLFIKLGYYFSQFDWWVDYSDDEKIEKILEFSAELEKYVNKRTFEETQLKDYNSQVRDFYIMFKQEIIAKTALFVKKKKYSYWVVNEEGVPTDELAVKGLELVRSDSAEAIRTRLKHVYEMIMKNEPDDRILDTIRQYKKELKEVAPEEIASNLSVNNIEKYIGGPVKVSDAFNGVFRDEDDDVNDPIKHTPYHVRGVHNYRTLLEALNLTNKYEDIYDGNKAKVLYVKDNMFKVDVVTFNDRWPKEFSQYMVIDYDTMINKFFTKKIGFLLQPMGKDHLLTSMATAERMIDSIFG